MNNKEIQKIGIFGMVAGIITTFLMKGISWVLNLLGQYTPEITAKLANDATPVIAINVRESLTGINAGLSGWLADALGLTLPTNVIMPYVLAAAGGALLFIAGAYIAEMFDMLKGNSEAKTRTVIFFGNALAAFIIGGFAVPALGISFVNALIAFGINAAILAWAYVAIDKQLKIGLVPF